MTAAAAPGDNPGMSRPSGGCATALVLWLTASCAGTGSLYGTTTGNGKRGTTDAVSSAGAAGTSGVATTAGASSGTSTASGSSTGGSTGTTGGACLDTANLSDCPAGKIEVATQIINGCAGSPLSQPIQVTNFYDPSLAGDTDDCGNGYFCVDAGTLLSPLVSAAGFIPIVGAQFDAQFSERVVIYMFCTNVVEACLGINLDEAMVAVQVYASTGQSANCPGAVDGWSFALTALDGGAVADFPLYAGGFGLDPTATATTAEGTALLANIDPSIGSVTLVGHFDGGPACENADGAREFTGVIPLLAGTISLVEFFTNADASTP